MDSESDILEKMEQQGRYGLVPSTVQKETYELLESNENIDESVVNDALDTASTYWKQHIVEKGQIEKNPQGLRLNYPDDFREEYRDDLAKELYREWRSQLEPEDVTELTETLTSVPEEDPFENVPWDSDPKYSPEDEDYPSMFQ